MKFLKMLLFALVGLIVLLLIFLPMELKVTKVIEIEAPKDIIFDHVYSLEKFSSFSPWHQIDPEMKVEWGEKREGPGAEFSWTSEHPDVGTGKMVNTQIDHLNSVENRLVFMGDEENAARSGFELMDLDEGKIQVKWWFDQTYESMALINRLIGALIKGKIEADFEKGLANLKEAAEKIPSDGYEFSMQEGTFPDMQFLAIKDSCATDKKSIQENYAKCFTELAEYFTNNKIPFTGMPMTISHVWDKINDKYVFECAIPIEEPKKIESDRIYFRRIPSGAAIVGNQKGSYDHLERSYKQMMWHVEKNELNMSGSPIEVYLNDPTTVAENEALTTIYYPI